MQRDSGGRYTEIELNINWILGKVEVQGTGCWHWSGYVNPADGYGRYRKRADGKNWLAHRLVFKIVNGYLPSVVMHSCDNRRCVNPEHLSEGSYAQNLKDMVDRGRGGAGMFKQQVPDKIREEIRDLAMCGVYTQAVIARFYRVDPSLVSRIKCGKDSNRMRRS